MKYRVVYNGEWYEIECRFNWIPFAWGRVRPSRYRYQPIDWSKYRFDSVEDAQKRIEELKKYDRQQKFEVVDEKSN